MKAYIYFSDSELRVRWAVIECVEDARYVEWKASGDCSISRIVLDPAPIDREVDFYVDRNPISITGVPGSLFDGRAEMGFPAVFGSYVLLQAGQKIELHIRE